MKLKTGQIAPNFQMEDVLGKALELKQFKGKKIFMAFLRNTNCPLCNLHVFKLSKQAAHLKSLGLEILVFYESDKKMFKNSDFFKTNVLDEQKFSVISDPQRKIYNLFGAEISPEKSTMEVLKNAGRFAEVEEAAKLGITGTGVEAGTHADAIPADFLIDEDFIIQYAHYGNDAGDNINLKLVENFAQTGKV
ncbi:MAG: redoxin domain-containing protein [Verrucomicrobia bacterium]|nr:redoxin domain-containing protein [Cytophagales bacterium]